MALGKHDATVQANASTEVRSSSALRQRWSVVAALLVAAIFAQAVFAGLMLSGVDWGREAHNLNSVALVAASLAAGVVSIVTLRRVPNGSRLGFTLLLLAVVVSLQTAVGRSSVAGANLMWVHIPLGVALVGFATQALAGARRLGGA